MVEKLIVTIPRERLLLGPVETVFDPDIRTLCRRPYPDHPHGCPNYGKRSDCPPHAPFFPRAYDTSAPNYLAVVKFDFAKYLEERRVIHPDWTERALRNPRHYQGHLRADLSRFVGQIMPQMDCGYEPIFNPEAMGVDIASMFPKVGLQWEFPPQANNYRVCLIAKKKS